MKPIGLRTAAEDAGLQPGDMVRAVNRVTVRSVDDFRQKIEQAKGRDSILLLIQRGENNLFAALSPK